MAGLILAPFLTELGIGLTAVAESIGISTGVAGVAGAVGSGYIGGQASTAIEKKVSEAVGLENIDAATKSYLDAKALALAAYNKDTKFFIDRKRNELATQNVSYHEPDQSPAVSGKNPSVTLSSDVSPGGNKVAVSTGIDPKIISKFIIGYANGIATQAQSGVIDETKVIKDIGMSVEISDKISKFISKGMSDNEQYKAIASVYNGKNLTVKGNIFMRYDKISNGLVFTLVDELNTISKLYQTKGLIIPPIWGTFVGPKSPNNKLPNDNDLLDLYASFHDESYSNGFFNEQAAIGDFKLISRISQNYDRLLEDSKPYARLTVSYFSTIAHGVNSLIGSLPKTIAKEVSKDLTKTDIYPIMVPESAALDPEAYCQQRTDFYAELENELVKEHLSNSVMAVYAPNAQMKLLAHSFGKLKVQLL